VHYLSEYIWFHIENTTEHTTLVSETIVPMLDHPEITKILSRIFTHALCGIDCGSNIRTSSSTVLYQSFVVSVRMIIDQLEICFYEIWARIMPYVEG
jgi:hypothetical protein